MPSDGSVYSISLSQPENSVGIEAAVLRVLRSGRWAFGPETAAFEREFASYVGSKYAVAVSSGTAALEFLGGFAAAKYNPEVFTFPAMTFRATWNGVCRGAGIDLDDAVVIDGPVVGGDPFASVDAWLFGVPRDSGGSLIADLCEYLVPGAHAQADPVVGSAFGFYPNKLLACGEGGMICTDREDVAESARVWRNHGRGECATIVRNPTNARMTELSAAIGREQLSTLPARLKRYGWLHREYEQGLRSCHGAEIVSAPGSFAFVLRISDRDSVAARLRRDGIECSTEYFPCWCSREGIVCRWPIAHAHALEHLAVPMHCGLGDDDVSEVCDSIRK